jgi:HSP20 family protein
MTLQTRAPFRDFRHIDSVMNRFWRNPSPRVPVQYADSWAIPLDVVQDDDSVVITASLPGFKAEDINVSIEDGALRISAETTSEDDTSTNGYLLRERRAGKFHRAIRLPKTVEPDGAESAYTEGVLTITLPKVENKKSRKLEVKVG